MCTLCSRDKISRFHCKNQLAWLKGCGRFRLSVIKQVVLNKQARSCYFDTQLQKRAGSPVSIKWNVKESRDMSLSKKSHQQLPGKTADLHLLSPVVNSIDKWNVSCVLPSGRILRQMIPFIWLFFKRFKYGSEQWEKLAKMMWKKTLPLHRNTSHLRVVVKVRGKEKYLFFLSSHKVWALLIIFGKLRLSSRESAWGIIAG